MVKFSIKKTAALKIIAYFALLCFLAVLQTTFFARFGLFGVTPDLMLAAVISISMYEGERGGGIAGVAAGYIIDAIGNTGISLHALPYMLCGYLCGLGFNYILNRNFPSFSLYILLSYLVREAFTLLGILASRLNGSFLQILRSVIIPEYFSSVLTAPLIYLLVRQVSRLFQQNRELK